MIQFLQVKLRVDMGLNPRNGTMEATVESQISKLRVTLFSELLDFSKLIKFSIQNSSLLLTTQILAIHL